jgi:inosine-uridine nucleoside N-ribohydrolase
MGSSATSHNFVVDPDATRQVFDKNWNIYQITKEDSLKIKFTREELNDLRKNQLGNFLADSAFNGMALMKINASAMYDVLVVSAAMQEGYVKFNQTATNRFISCGVDLQLKNKIREAINNAS